MLDDTLVVVTSDHGENFGEGGLMAHAFSLDERLTHVPLVAAGPGAEALAGARRPRRPAARARAAPPAIAHPGGPDLCRRRGPEFDPPTGPDDERVLRRVEGEWGVGGAGLRVMTTPLTSATDSRAFKLRRRGWDEELFDLDQRSRSNSIRSTPRTPRADQLRAALDPAPAIAHSQPDASPAELAEIEERMKLLGYM